MNTGLHAAMINVNDLYAESRLTDMQVIGESRFGPRTLAKVLALVQGSRGYPIYAAPPRQPQATMSCKPAP